MGNNQSLPPNATGFVNPYFISGNVADPSRFSFNWRLQQQESTRTVSHRRLFVSVFEYRMLCLWKLFRNVLFVGNVFTGRLIYIQDGMKKLSTNPI